MKTLITGIDGFIGTWLLKSLSLGKDQIYGIGRHNKSKNKKIKYFQADICDHKKIKKIIVNVKPDRIFHLAAQSNIPDSFTDPVKTLKINVLGTLNILEIIRHYLPQTVLISTGSSSEYGCLKDKKAKFSEIMKLHPSSPYAISKVMQYELVKLYRKTYGLKLLHIRPFAVIGPGKKADAVSDFAKGIVSIERKEKKDLHIGNISHIRDFIDVRDMVRAMIVLSEIDIKENIVNICTGNPKSLRDILDIFISLSDVKIKIVKDKRKVRVIDDQIIVGDPIILKKTGFKERYTLKQTLFDILDYWRKQK